MIAAIGGFLAKIGLSFFGDILLKWDAQRQQEKQTVSERSGALQQAMADTAGEAARQGRIAKAEATADRSQDGIIESARRGEF